MYVWEYLHVDTYRNNKVFAPAGAILTIICRSLLNASKRTRTVRSSPVVTAWRNSRCLIRRTCSRASGSGIADTNYINCINCIYKQHSKLYSCMIHLNFWWLQWPHPENSHTPLKPFLYPIWVSQQNSNPWCTADHSLLGSLVNSIVPSIVPDGKSWYFT